MLLILIITIHYFNVSNKPSKDNIWNTFIEKTVDNLKLSI